MRAKLGPMKIQLSAFAVAAFLLTGCTGTNPTNAPTPIDGPSDVAASASASVSAKADASASAKASESEASSSESETTTGTASSKGSEAKKASESKKATPSKKPAASPSTIVSSDKADTTREGGAIDIAPSGKGETTTKTSGANSLISVTTKEGGKGTIKLGGKADVYEGTVIATATNTETGKSTTQHTTASCGNGCTGTWSLSFSGLEAGTYKVTVSESDESDGEGKAPYSVDVTVKVS